MNAILRKVAIGATFATAALAASPASAADIVDPCSATWVSGGIACVGYVSGNLFTGSTGSATTTTQQGLITQLLTGTPNGTGSGLTTTAGYQPGTYGSLATGTVLGSISPLNGATNINFANLLLNGLTVVGIHFGNTPDAGGNQNTSAFWLVDVNGPTHTLTLTNGQGSSNAQIFATGSAVPEPSTWALMLLGFGGMGVSMRRRRPVSALPQMA